MAVPIIIIITPPPHGGRQAEPDLADQLRDIADQVEAGECKIIEKQE